jgi:MFS family permease
MSAIRWRRTPSFPGGPGAPGAPDTETAASAADGRLITLIRWLLLFESSLYSAVTPVLPHYGHSLHASKPALGLLAAAYPAGLIPGALIGGWIASRLGVRRTTVAGLIVFGVGIAGFGFGTNILALDLLRVVQGASCGLIWGGGLTWAIAVAPRPRRGAVIGTLIAAATLGTLLGPLLGTAAVTLGTRPVFCLLGGISLILAGLTWRHPEPGHRPQAEAAHPLTRPIVVAALRDGLGMGVWLITLEAMTIGATNVLIPLRLSRFGASGLAIGATFLLAAALSSALSPIVGRLTDRHGTRPTLVVGLAASAVLLSALLLPHGALMLAGVSVVALGGPLVAYMIPAVSMMTESAERAGIALVLATTLVNLAYATGETIGAPVAAGLSQATSDAVPLLLVAGLMLVTLRLVLARRAAPELSQPPTDATPPPDRRSRPPQGTRGARPERPGRRPPRSRRRVRRPSGRA